MRYTRAFVNARFELAMHELGCKTGDVWAKDEHGHNIANVGAYFLDYYAIGGGYRIERMNTKGGGITNPFGSQRYRAREFIALLDGILGCAYIKQHGC